VLFLWKEDPEKDVQLYINSPGGSITAGNGHLRHHAYIKTSHDIVRWAGGLDGGHPAWRRVSPKKRYRCRTRRILIHQPLMSGLSGQAKHDIHAREILRMRETMNNVLAKHTGQKLDKMSAT